MNFHRAHLPACLLTALLAAALLGAPASAEASQGWQVPLEVPGGLGGLPPTGLALHSGEADVAGFGPEVAPRPPGSSWGRPQSLAEHGRYPVEGDEYRGPELVTDESGDLFTAWGITRGCRVLIQTDTKPAGGSWAPPVTVWEGEGADCPSVRNDPRALSVEIAVDPGGDMGLTWSAVKVGGSESPRDWAATRKAGGAWTAAQPLAAGGGYLPPRIAIDPLGNVTAVWQDQETGGLLATTGPAGSSLSGSEPVAPPGGPPIRTNDLDLTIDRSGEALAAWCSYCERGSHGSVEVAWKSPGGAWSAPEALSPAANHPLGSEVVLDPAGNATAAWSNELEPRSVRVMVASRLAGSRWNGPSPLSPAGMVAGNPAVAVGGGSGILAWSTWNPVTGEEGIEAAVRPANRGWQFAEPTVLRNEQGAGAQPIAAMDRGGNAIVAWASSKATKVLTDDYLVEPGTLPAPNLFGIGQGGRRPGDDNTPQVQGSAPIGSTVSLFTTSTCRGTPIASGSATELAGEGIQATVRYDSTTDFYATSTEGGETSGCSGPLAYTESSTAIDMQEALAKMPVLAALGTPEDPLDAEGRWSAGGLAAGPGFVVAGGWTSHLGPPGIEGAYWVPTVFPDSGTGTAASIRVGASPGVAKGFFSLWLDMPEPAVDKAGYELRLTQIGSNTYNAELRSWTHGAGTILGTIEDVALPAGSIVALADRGGELEVWAEAGAGYVHLGSVADSEFGTGYAGMTADARGVRLRRFAAEALPLITP